MNTVEVSQRLTHKYWLGWSGLDEWSDNVIRLRLTPVKNGTAFARLPAGVPFTEVKLAIEDTLARGCTCEHDCGCTWWYAIAHRYGRRQVRIVIRSVHAA